MGFSPSQHPFSQIERADKIIFMTETKQHFDCVVLGSGPGGYPAAIRASQLGLSVALIEAKDLGGTCLNRGCIPSKALIASARAYHEITRSQQYGISVKEVSFDYRKMVERAQEVVTSIREGLSALLQANGITIFRGHGKFVSPRELKVLGEDNLVIEGKSVIIASGSEPRRIPAFECDGKRIHDSTSFLQLRELPKKMIVIGGGVIGCEFASMLSLLGVEVEIVEMLPCILSSESEALSQILTQELKARGVAIHTKVTVKGVEKTDCGIDVVLEEGKTLKGEMALVSVGRKVNSDEIGIEKAGLKTKPNGAIEVDSRMRTSVDGIYAIGDVTAHWWLAHVATHHGLVAASEAAGLPMDMHENAVPSIVFTDPEIASVGLTAEEAKEKGIKVQTGRYPFQALGKSKATGHPNGFAEIVADQETGQILGAQVAGQEAASLIAEMTLAIANELTIDCLVGTIHAHPTLPEVWLEAALVARGTPIHLPPKKRKEATQDAPL